MSCFLFALRAQLCNCGSRVKVGTHFESGEQVALKLVDRSRIKDGSREKKNLVREIEAMEALKHSNVIQLKAVDWEASYPKKDGTRKVRHGV